MIPFRLRPIYGENELTGGELLQRGLASAIGRHEADLEEARQEANTMGAQGATRLPDPPNTGILGKIRGIGDALQRGIYGDRPTPAAPVGATAPAVYTDVMGGLTRRVPNVAGLGMGRVVMDGGGINGTFAGEPGVPPAVAQGRVPGTAWDEKIPLPYNEANIFHPPLDAAVQTTPADPGTSMRPSIATALQAQGGSQGGSLDPDTYEYQGKGGRRYVIDRNRAARQALAVRAAENAQTLDFEGAKARQSATISDQFRDAQNEEAAAALALAKRNPTPENVARARVLTNTVRYDEEYGQRAGMNGNGLTFEQRTKLQAQRDAAALQRARLAAQGREQTDEYRRADLAYRQAEATLRDIDRQIADEQKNIPAPGVPSIVAGSNPALRARADSAQSRITDLNRQRDSVRRTLPHTSAPTPTTPSRPPARETQPPRGSAPGTPPGGYPQGRPNKSAVDRAKELAAAGLSRQAIYEQMKKEGYNVLPPKK